MLVVCGNDMETKMSKTSHIVGEKKQQKNTKDHLKIDSLVIGLVILFLLTYRESIYDGNKNTKHEVLHNEPQKCPLRVKYTESNCACVPYFVKIIA